MNKFKGSLTLFWVTLACYLTVKEMAKYYEIGAAAHLLLLLPIGLLSVFKNLVIIKSTDVLELPSPIPVSI